MLRVGIVLDLLRAAGPLASLNVVIGLIAALLALATVALAIRGSKLASITTVLCLLFALISVGLGFAGHTLALTTVDTATANVPDDMKLSLRREGTMEARAHFRIALAWVFPFKPSSDVRVVLTFAP